MPESSARQRADLQPEDGLIGARVGRYLIRARVGSGGMGEVYRADDSVLKRPVALKRVTPAFSGDLEYHERFLKEAERASKVTDQHIAAIYDVLQENGEVFLVMEYVEGRTLRQRASQPLGMSEFFDIAEQSAQALHVAHEKGILHGDIKPENIMLTPSGLVKILDFGLARQIPRAGAQEGENPTTSQARELTGTPAYMAPEILLEQAPDQRADIFSMGVVFYEVLTGDSPFKADSFVGTTDRILREDPPPIRRSNPSVPRGLERVVFKMLAKTPGHRYATASEVLADLKQVREGAAGPAFRTRAERMRFWGILTAVGLLAIVLALTLIARVRQPKAGRAERSLAPAAGRYLAVLPFQAINADDQTRAFSYGLTETLTTKLAQLTQKHPLQVAPASDIRTQQITSAEKAQAVLGANLVLEGSLQRSGEKMRVNYSLVDIHSHRQLGADSLTELAADSFALEDRVVESVLSRLEVELGAEERRALGGHDTSPAAYDFYVRGRGYLQEYEKPENIANAITEFQHALGRDPNYALAYAGLGESYWQQFVHTHQNEWIARATEACQQAVKLGGNLANGYTCLGMVHNETGQYESAAQEFQRALELDGTSDDAYRGLAFAYEHLDRPGDAEATYKRAIAMRPHYWAGYSWMGRFLLDHGRYPEAVEMFKQVIALAPDSFRGYSNLGATYVLSEKYKEAIHALEQSVAIRPTASAYSNLGAAHFYLRQFEDAATNYENAVRLDPRRSSLTGNLAEAYYWVPGKRGDALATFRKALQQTREDLKVNPRDGMRLSEMAFYLSALGDANGAQLYSRQALAVGAKDPEVWLKVAQAAVFLRQDKECTDYLKQAVDLGLPPGRARQNPAFDRLQSNAQFKAVVGE
ncbi:MAG TPA: protein kinase [Terriglobales bacterium]|nr:protein kinase [Terriglobales bacterium]